MRITEDNYYRVIKRTYPEGSGTIGRFEVENTPDRPTTRWKDPNPWVEAWNGSLKYYIRQSDTDDYEKFCAWERGDYATAYTSPIRLQVRNEKIQLGLESGRINDEYAISLELKAHQARLDIMEKKKHYIAHEHRIEQMSKQADEDEKKVLAEMFGEEN